ncbi:DUF431 domain-containing protein [Histoplasma ohiense]|nr:DUF431 domain-containing protein [Histoplasma ohiense (nom. inval.)]
MFISPSAVFATRLKLPHSRSSIQLLFPVSYFPLPQEGETIRETMSNESQTLPSTATFVVEHLDPELGSWSALEYGCIAQESSAAGVRFLLTSVPESLKIPDELAALDNLEVEHRAVEEIFADRKEKICLLDPSAKAELRPQDGDEFEVFLFGGILGTAELW